MGIHRQLTIIVILYTDILFNFARPKGKSIFCLLQIDTSCKSETNKLFSFELGIVFDKRTIF